MNTVMKVANGVMGVGVLTIGISGMIATDGWLVVYVFVASIPVTLLFGK